MNPLDHANERTQRGGFAWVAMAVALLLGSLAFVGGTPAAGANEFAPGGGGGYCPAEFWACPSGGSWCSWYGWCGAGGGGVGYGGGGGGGYEPNFDGPRDCGRTYPVEESNGWQIKDLGTCATIAICHTKRDLINVDRSGSDARAYCWANWNLPHTNGRHLVLARPIPITTSDTIGGAGGVFGHIDPDGLDF